MLQIPDDCVWDEDFEGELPLLPDETTWALEAKATWGRCKVTGQSSQAEAHLAAQLGPSLLINMHHVARNVKVAVQYVRCL